jgi:hypothetical protein
MFGRDVRLLESRKWVLQSLGYRVLTMQSLADLSRIPLTPPIALFVLCPTISAKEGAQAVGHVSSLWPEVKKLVLVRDGSKGISKLLGKALLGHASKGRASGIQVRQTLDSPTLLMSMVRELVGYASSSPCSHTY